MNYNHFIKKLSHSNLFRNFIFWIGTVRHLCVFPWVTWDHHNPCVTHDEIDQNIVPKLEIGDVGVHCDHGFLSNLFIPGSFKHAWIHVDQTQIIEATHEGVLQKSCRNPLRTDDLVIVRPKLPLSAKMEAVERAKTALGFVYDVNFDFDLKSEFRHLNKHDQAFSCIEVVAYAYY